MCHPVYPATVSALDTTSGTVKVTVGYHPPVIVPWRGSEIAAVNEALDLIECEPVVVDESPYPFVAIEQLLAELTAVERHED